jgi:hypothetical protein
MVGELSIDISEEGSDGKWGWDDYFFEGRLFSHWFIYVIVCIVIRMQGETIMAKSGRVVV